MKKTPPSKNSYNKILSNIINHIEQSKLRAFSEVNKALLNAYWNIGKELSENASYGKSVVEQLSRDLRLKYPEAKGYSVANLRNMKRFYETYHKKLQPVAGESGKLQPLAAELLFNVSWTNHVLILDKTSSDEEKQFYLKMCIKERWSKRELDRQLDSSLFERYIFADKPEKVTALIPKHDSKDLTKHIKDMYVLDFLNLRKEYSEQELEKAILDNLRDFFLEFGKSFTFMGSQYALDIGGRENRIDLLFFHRELKCIVAVDLKIGEFKAVYVGQMQKYLAALDKKIRLPDEKESIGLILCKSKNYEEVRFALAKTLSPIKVATYKTKLPDKKLILKRLEQFPSLKR
ncbi:MAG: PDDEXK nuclease domain-containing protein [Thermotogota bacterium]|nr:PDDEXK nuclease domain-containing protein [Thermotogota bacterium]